MNQSKELTWEYDFDTRYYEWAAWALTPAIHKDDIKGFIRTQRTQLLETHIPKKLSEAQAEQSYKLGVKHGRESLKEELLGKVEKQILDKIYYIGSELPQVKEDVRDKFVLLGTPADFLDELSALSKRD